MSNSCAAFIQNSFPHPDNSRDVFATFNAKGDSTLMRPRLYLKVGDIVRHVSYIAWGDGEVVEEKHSTLPGGICLVRILFEDGNERAFINDLNNQCCCYYAGIRVCKY